MFTVRDAIAHLSTLDSESPFEAMMMNEDGIVVEGPTRSGGQIRG